VSDFLQIENKNATSLHFIVLLCPSKCATHNS